MSNANNVPDTAGNTPELVIKIPVVVEARQFTEEMAWAYLLEKTPLPPGVQFCSASYHRDDHRLDRFRAGVTVAGGTLVMLEFGDWILRDPNTGDTWPIKPKIYATTYERVAAPSLIYGDAFNLIGLLRSVVACGEKLNKDDDAEISRVLHALRVERDKAEAAPSQEAAPPQVTGFGDWCDSRGVLPTMGVVENYASDRVRRAAFDIKCQMCGFRALACGHNVIWDKVAEPAPSPATIECARCHKKVTKVVAPDGGGACICAECDAPSPATKDTPTVYRAWAHKFNNWLREESGAKFHLGLPGLNKLAELFHEAVAKSISQGPAREETPWMTSELPQDEVVLAEIEYKYSGHSITERIVCVLKGDDLETEAGDDIGWTSEVVTKWMRIPGAQSRTPTNLKSRTEPDKRLPKQLLVDGRVVAEYVGEAATLESRTVAPQLEKEK